MRFSVGLQSIMPMMQMPATQNRCFTWNMYIPITGNIPLTLITAGAFAFTDAVDGFIARKFNLITNFGKLIDPLADKITQVSILGTLLLLISIIAPLIFKSGQSSI